MPHGCGISSPREKGYLANMAGLLPDHFIVNTLSSLATFMAVGAVFTLLSLRFSITKRTAFFSRELARNLVYYLIGPLYNFALALVVAVGLIYLGKDDAAIAQHVQHGAPFFAQWALWQQALALMLVMDFLQYGVHRWLHGAALWPFHAIHHAPHDIDWHHSLRFHPLNYLVYITFTSAICVLLGFSLEVILWLAPFNMVYSQMVHTNLNWTFGPLRYVLASPVFHRWHHSDQPEAAGKNLAPTFPFIDLIFGSFYMPRDKQPLTLGAPGADVPDSVWGQMRYPFLQVRALLGRE